MAARSKILRRMRENQTDWRIEDLERAAEEAGIEHRCPRGGGSHVIFSAPGVEEIVSVPAHRPIKPVYVKHFLALVDRARESRTK